MDPQGEISWGALAAHGKAAGLFRRFAWPDAVVAIPRGPVYLASPVSWYLERGMEDIAEADAAMWAGYLIAHGFSPFSPASQWLAALRCAAPEARDALLAMDHADWMDRCLGVLLSCRAVVIPPIPGWTCSRGVWIEACTAIQRNMPVVLIDARADAVAA